MLSHMQVIKLYNSVIIVSRSLYCFMGNEVRGQNGGTTGLSVI